MYKFFVNFCFLLVLPIFNSCGGNLNRDSFDENRSIVNPIDNDLNNTVKKYNNIMTIPDSCPFETGVRKDRKTIKKPTFIVDDNASLILAIQDADNYDSILIEDGTYDIGEVEVLVKGLLIYAKNRHKARFVGRSKFILKKDEISIDGLGFYLGDDDVSVDSAAITIKGDDIHINAVEFSHWGDLANNWSLCISVGLHSNQVEISNSIFTNLHSMSILQQQEFKAGYKSAKSMWIHHNLWKNNKRAFGYGGESAQIGLANSSKDGVGAPLGESYDNELRVLFEYNHIINHNLESEILSIKSDSNIVRYNLFEDSRGAVVVRMGNENLIYGNWFENINSAVRISGERNIIAFNYYNSNSKPFILLHNSLKYKEKIDGLHAMYWAANKTLVVNNIIQNSPTFIEVMKNFSPKDTEFLSYPKGGVYKNNLFLNSSDSFIDSSGYIDEEIFKNENIFKDNINFIEVEQKSFKANENQTLNLSNSIDIDPSLYVSNKKSKLKAPFWWDKIIFKNIDNTLPILNLNGE